MQTSLLLSAQEIVTDTLIISFKTDTIIPEHAVISPVIDLRKENNKVVGYANKRKYLLIPVEQEICIPEALSTYLLTGSEVHSPDSLTLEINYFATERYKGHFFNNYVLMADFAVYRVNKDTTDFLGTLVYNYEYQPHRKKTPQDKAIEQMLPLWHTQFKLDMLSVNSYAGSKRGKPENLLVQRIEKPHYLNLLASTVVGLNFRQLDGEIYLTRPETTSGRWFMARTVRYQNTPDYEMFAVGKRSEHFSYRKNDLLRFNVNSNLMLGFVKWRNAEEIKLHQIFQFSLSSNQCIVLEKQNQQGWILKTGLFENLNYVIEMSPKIQLGILLGAGYKF